MPEEREKRWPDVPPAARAWVEQLSPKQIEGLLAVADLYRRNPDVWDWLTSRRQEEIQEIDESIELMRSLRRSGRFVKWVFVILATTFLGAVALGQSIGTVMSWFRR